MIKSFSLDLISIYVSEIGSPVQRNVEKENDENGTQFLVYITSFHRESYQDELDGRF